MTEKINRVLDCVGREWHVTESAVREDYIQFLMEADGLSREEAEQAAEAGDGKEKIWGLRGYWFAEQIVDCPRHVMAIGTLAVDISAEAKQSVVDLHACRGRMEILS